MAPQIESHQRKGNDEALEPKKVDVVARKGKNTRGTKGEQMRTDPEAHGIIVHDKKKDDKKRVKH